MPANLRIEKVKAVPITRPRIIGDIGLRGFFQLYLKAKNIIKTEKIDFLYIPIASFYCALIGRWLNKTTGIKYGIDYMDPWVHTFPGSNKMFTRHWFSTKVACLLEPIAVKKASLITGVAEAYYLPVFDRNPQLKNIIFGAMPMGGEIEDHKMAATLKTAPYLFTKKNNKIQLMYAGAMLPKAYEPLKKIFEAISVNREIFKDVEFYFVGTGVIKNGITGHTIKPLAEAYGISETIIFEHPQRIPYLDVLIHLENVDAVFILGSTEAHYSPSKVYQGILSSKPILAVLHQQSTAINVVRGANAGIVLAFNGEEDINVISQQFTQQFKNFLNFCKSFDPSKTDVSLFKEYSALNVTGKLARLLDEI